MAAATDSPTGIRCSLALEMAARRLTVRELAEQAGVHVGAISRLRGNRMSMVDLATLNRLCRYLKLEVGDLLHLDPPLHLPDEDNDLAY